MKSQEELKIELTEDISLKHMIKQACRKFGGQDNSKTKIYNKKAKTNYKKIKKW